MADSFIRALDAEIEALNADLRADPRFVKVQELQKVRALYALADPDPTPPAPPAVEATVRAALGGEITKSTLAAAIQAGRQRSPEREAALKMARDMIAGRRNPTPTAEIALKLLKNQITLPGKNMINNLSALLSSVPEFRAHGRSGWTYEPENAEAANGQIPGQDPLAASNAPRSTSENPTRGPVNPVPGGGT